MTQAKDDAGVTGKRRKRRSFNWVAVSAVAALLSATAAMVTAGNGVWRPPVSIPAIQVKVAWVGPTPAAAQPAVAAQSLASTPPSAPSPSSQPTTYQADWTNGMGGWVGGVEWKSVGATLISDGQSGDSRASVGRDAVRPPFRPAAPDYSVTARIRIVSDPQQNGCDAALQLRVAPDGQGQETHGYYLGYAQGTGAVIASFRPTGTTTTISHTIFSPGSDWHDYAAAAKDNLLTLKIDGSTVLQAPDNNYLDAGQVGIISDACQLQVANFNVAPS